MYISTKVSHSEKTGDTVSAAAPCEKVIPSMSKRNGVLGGGSEAIPWTPASSPAVQNHCYALLPFFSYLVPEVRSTTTCNARAQGSNYQMGSLTGDLRGLEQGRVRKGEIKVPGSTIWRARWQVVREQHHR